MNQIFTLLTMVPNATFQRAKICKRTITASNNTAETDRRNQRIKNMLTLPRITKTFLSNFINLKPTKQASALSKSVSPPTEEMVNHLNRIGQEYPFCVNNKQRMNDPL